MGVLSGFKSNLVSDLKSVGKQYAGELAGGLIDKLPTQARKLASGALKEFMGKETITGADIPVVRRTGERNDWRCKLSWIDLDTNTKLFDYLPGKNTVVWPYTPQFTINYQANYEAVKTLQTNYATYAYQGSDTQNLMITGIFTATTVAEANYLYSVIHFLKSATKGYNLERNDMTGKPPPILRLNYLGEGAGIANMPVVIQSFNMDYPATVDYIRAIVPNAGTAMVPAEVTIAVSLVPIYARRDLIAVRYSTSKFVRGELLGSGHF